MQTRRNSKSITRARMSTFHRPPAHLDQISSTIHTETVMKFIQHVSDRILNRQPPHILAEEEPLPRAYKAYQSGYCIALNGYRCNEQHMRVRGTHIYTSAEHPTHPLHQLLTAPARRPRAHLRTVYPSSPTIRNLTPFLPFRRALPSRHINTQSTLSLTTHSWGTTPLPYTHNANTSHAKIGSTCPDNIVGTTPPCTGSDVLKTPTASQRVHRDSHHIHALEHHGGLHQGHLRHLEAQTLHTL